VKRIINKLVLLGGLSGAFLILFFTIGSFSLFNQFSDLSISNLVIASVLLLFAPLAGGFVAGKIGKTNPRKAGLIAGSGAGLVVWITWLIVAGVSFQNLLSGMVILVIWVFLARLASGFINPP